jgi:aspartyl-tRNA synthetase
MNLKTTLRTHTCGELRISDVGKTVTLCGWVQRIRKMGAITFLDLRDRYGITQIYVDTKNEISSLVDGGIVTKGDNTLDAAKKDIESLSRECVICIKGLVVERVSKNPDIETGEIEIVVSAIKILNNAKIPPFTIEDDTDGGDELRMKYRYLDLRRSVVRKNLELRHRMAIETRNYLDKQNFLEVETPVLIKSTPEGARDYVVPSRLHEGEFYALPQSPQTFKQLLMVSGFDRYYQIVKCFRDEDLRADRQPEFTQIDCEMSFVKQEDILQTFEGLVRHLFKAVKNIDIPALPLMSYADAMKYYGNDKPDIRFEMKFVELNNVAKGRNFKVFDDAELVVGICATGAAEYTRKQIDELTEFVKRPQIGASGMVYLRYNKDGSLKSSVDKFYDEESLKKWAAAFNAKPGDLILILAGEENKTRKALSELRLEMGTRLGLRDKNKFSCLWVVDFPLLEWNEGDTNLLESLRGRWVAKHHPFTSPKPEDVSLLDSDPGMVRANAYDMVINGIEVGGGSIRIHSKDLQAKMFEVLGFSKEEAQNQFGFLMNAFEFGAPPHGGIAFGFDRLCSLFGGADSIRDFIAFPKNNAARDMMIDSPSDISEEQLNELHLLIKRKDKV